MEHRLIHFAEQVESTWPKRVDASLFRGGMRIVRGSHIDHAITFEENADNGLGFIYTKMLIIFVVLA